MNSLQMIRARRLSYLFALASLPGICANAIAGVNTTQLPDAASWPATPTLSTTGSLNLQTDFNTEVTITPTSCVNTGGCVGAATHTFVPDTSFKLDKFMIRLAGAPSTGEIYLYPAPVGGTDLDGYVDVSFSTTLLNGGAALPFTFNGNDSRRLMEFDLTGSDEIILSAGTKYAIDIRNTGPGTMYWLRTSNSSHLNDYLPGNIYGTNDNTNAGQRFDVGGGRRDGTLALYAPVPAGVPGDYNNNGTVDAADYVLWRKGGTLANEVDTPGTVNAADYTEWRARFGNPSSGSGLGVTAVPEPSTLLLLVGAAAGVLAFRRTDK